MKNESFSFVVYQFICRAVSLLRHSHDSLGTTWDVNSVTSSQTSFYHERKCYFPAEEDAKHCRRMGPRAGLTSGYVRDVVNFSELPSKLNLWVKK